MPPLSDPHLVVDSMMPLIIATAMSSSSQSSERAWLRLRFSEVFCRASLSLSPSFSAVSMPEPEESLSSPFPSILGGRSSWIFLAYHSKGSPPCRSKSEGFSILKLP